ncbi:MAG: hypothetical protein KGJ55_02825 [Gammaproteobacteria bacterium]|nr:hypothetical protein [Gammaproteobacteria bacterium]
MKSIRATLLGACLCTIPVAAVLADPCAGLAHCDDAGPFSAQVTGAVPAWGRYHKQRFVRLNLRFRNPGSQPLILGFPWRSGATLTDNYGNSYGMDTRYATVIGLGIVKHGSADARFVIAPGASRTATLVFSRWVGKTAVGNRYTADFSVVTLQPIPGNNQVRVGSTYTLNFPDLSSAVVGGDALGNGAATASDVGKAVKSLLNVFAKPKPQRP